MNSIKHKLSTILCAVALLFGFAAPLTIATTTVSAQVQSTENIDPKQNDCQAKSKDLSSDNCGIIKMILAVTNIMAGLAGVAIVATLTFAGIQYSSAGADPGKVQAAKGKMFNAGLALLLLVFGYALLQWMVPGGIF
jgi:hypothetical protein